MLIYINQNKAKVVLLFLGILSIYSCESIKNEDHFNLMELEHLDTLFFPLDATTIRNKIRIGYLEDLNLLYVHNENPKKIDFYDFSDQTLVQTIKFDEIDSKRVFNKTMIHVVSPDSIFVYNQMTNSLLLYLDKGKELLDFGAVLDEKEKADYGLMPWCYFYRNNSGNFIFGVTIRGESVKKTNASPVLSFSEKTNKKKFYGVWPESYAKDNQMSFAGPSFLEVNDDLFLSMSFSDELQVINSSGDLINTIYAGSKLMHSHRGQRGNSSALEESARYQLTNSKYMNLIYDKSSGYLIREGSIGSNIPDNVSPLSGEKFPSRNNDDIYFVLIVIDPEIGKVGEIHGSWIGNDSFSTKDGLYIHDRYTDPKNEDVLIVNKMRIK